MSGETPKSVEDYIAALPADHAEVIREVRAAVLRGVPGAEEKISYSMPCIVLTGRANLFYAAHAHHVGVYPIWNLSPELETEIQPFRSTENTLQFKYKDGVPYDLIERIARESAASTSRPLV